MAEAVTYLFLGAALVAGLGYLKSRYLDFMAQRPEDYASTGETFDVRRHLNGPLMCEGVIYGPTGRVTSRFVGEFDAHWNGNKGVMHEHFTYDSGAEQHREWNLTLGNDGRIRATAPDVVGEGEGWTSGPSVKLRYRIKLEEDAGGHVLDTIDWMYLAPNGSIVNRSQFRKFGIKVAELVAVMRPRDVKASEAA